MKTTLLKIKAQLDKMAIPYSITGQADEATEYTFASIKNKIDNGIYYLDTSIRFYQENIQQSIIFTTPNTAEQTISSVNGNLIFFVEEPQVIFYQLMQAFVPQFEPTIHPTAIIHPEAIIHKHCHIGPYAVIGKCEIAENCFIDAHVIIADEVFIGKNTKIEGHTYIGATGVAWTFDKAGNKINQPQIGSVHIAENCFIGSSVSIVRGSVNESTTIGAGTTIAHGTKIGHGTIIGENCHFANNVSTAGNSCIGNNSFLGSGAVVSSHVKVERFTVIGAGAVVTESFTEEGIILTGVPASKKGKLEKGQKLNGVPYLGN